MKTIFRTAFYLRSNYVNKEGNTSVMARIQKELSYFRLKLESYLSEHFPEKVEGKPFIKARADEALTTYCDAVEEGFSYPEAESMASEVLYRDLHFSKYDSV